MRILTKTIVKRALKDSLESPERSARNLVDMALNFSRGRFQKNFFAAAQEILGNEQSAYYKLIRDISLTADPDRILTFGMNVGYTSCTVGAKRIRETERQQHFNIPWSVTLFADPERNPEVVRAFPSVIRQGKELGIYTWLLFAENQPQELLPAVKDNPDCAFVLFCRGDEFTDALMDQADSLHNLLFAVRYEKAAEHVCEKLRERKYPYAVYAPYEKEDAGMITSGGMLCCMEALRPVFAFFLPDTSCPEYIQQVVYNYVCEARKSQKYRTIPIDLVYDNHAIDSVISDDACTAVFDSSGKLMREFCKVTEPGDSFLENRLSDIFRRSFPKEVKGKSETV